MTSTSNGSVADIPVPTRDLAFKQWANSLMNTLPSLTYSVPGDETQWREWVDDFIQLNHLLYLPVPNLYQFPKDSDWKTWVHLFISLYYEENE